MLEIMNYRVCSCLSSKWKSMYCFNVLKPEENTSSYSFSLLQTRMYYLFQTVGQTCSLDRKVDGTRTKEKYGLKANLSQCNVVSITFHIYHFLRFLSIKKTLQFGTATEGDLDATLNEGISPLSYFRQEPPNRNSLYLCCKVTV